MTDNYQDPCEYLPPRNETMTDEIRDVINKYGESKNTGKIEIPTYKALRIIKLLEYIDTELLLKSMPALRSAIEYLEEEISAQNTIGQICVAIKVATLEDEKKDG